MLPLLTLLGLVGLCSANGLPPFMLLSPPKFRAGHEANMKLVMFSEVRGNISVKYYNYTQQWYPEKYYFEDVLHESVMDIDVSQSSIIDIPLTVPSTIEGTHNVMMSGFIEHYGPFSFTAKQLSVNQYGYKTYVQTDKPVYKPGQPVRFRGFSVDSDLKGLMLGEQGLKVQISNPDGIKVFDEVVTSEAGVIHQGTFLIAEEAKIGLYTISVNGRSSASCSFSVEEYVLPKFGVEIEGPGHISRNDSIVRGKVRATYTYGKAVNGQLKLKFSIDNRNQRLYSGAYLFQELTVDLVDGTADWEIDITDLTERKLKYLFNPWCTPSVLQIHATVTDENGGFNVEKTDSTTKFSQSSLKLTFNQNTQKNYAAGFPYYVEIDAKALTASEIENMPVTLTMISGLTDLQYVTKEVLVQDGKVYASFDVPEDACALKITAEMNIASACDAVFACFQPERMVSKSDEYVRFVKTEPRSYIAGDQASYKIISNKPLEKLHLIVLSKGNIVKSWNVVPDWVTEETGRYSIEDSLMIPQDMITRSRLLVLSANAMSGYLLADAIDLCIIENLRHNLQLNFDSVSAKPGDNVTVYLTSDPRSFVGLSVNDASLNLLREPCKVLTKESSLSFLRGLDEGTTKDLACKKDDPYQCKSSTEVKIIDIEDLLQSEGLDIDTNMNLFNYIPPAPADTFDDRYPYYGYEYGRSGGPQYMTMEKSWTSAMEMDNMEMANDVEDPQELAEEDAAPRLRNYFPEAWLWTDVVSDGQGKNVLSVVAPDTITGWVGNAFGLSPDNGLGFSNEIEFQTFLPFFVSLDLPYSGTVGERITVPIRIFNYLDTEITAEVTITSQLWEDLEQSVTVLPNKAATIDYTISLTEAGNHDILVEAFSNQGESDAIEKSLFVQPGGEKVTNTESLLIMERRRNSDKAVMNVELPDNFIPGSHDLKLVVVGDILGEAVSGISNLIQLPSGCGEQNMHKIATNVFAANYLRSMYDELPENIDYNIKHNLNIGIQQQLAYRKGSGSYSYGYSIFTGGSTSDWLTAFVHKISAQFPEDIFVPCDSAFTSDRDYLLRLIAYADDATPTTTVGRTGWSPYQYSYHRSKDLYWHSYFLISLLESEGTNRCGSPLTQSSYYSEKVSKVCRGNYLSVRYSDDCCYHHMVAYSLQLCQEKGFLTPQDVESALDTGKCIGSSTDGRYKFATCQDNLEFESVKGSSKSIEATGYAALYLMARGQVEDSLPMIMWLASQRNENGGFRSSQDTVIGLQALSKFAEAINADLGSTDDDLVLVIGKGRSYFEKVILNNDNRLAVKEVIFAPAIGDYKIKWSGTGTAFVQLVSTYHISNVEYEPIFGLQSTVSMMDDMQGVSVSFTLPRDAASTMYLLEMSAPTGMVFTKALVEGQMQLTDGGFSTITRYDIKQGGQRLQLYIDPEARTDEIVLDIPLHSKFAVVNRMPAQISLVDYYNPSQRQTIFYAIEDSDNDTAAPVDSDDLVVGDDNCALTLTCDILQNTEAILIGSPGKISGNSFVVKNAMPYKACQGSFVRKMKATVQFESTDKPCVKALGNNRSFFLLNYLDDDEVEVTGMADYAAVLAKVTECYSTLLQCPTQ